MSLINFMVQRSRSQSCQEILTGLFIHQPTVSYMSSWKSSKEGDLPFASWKRGRFCVKPFRDIISTVSIQVPAEMLKRMKYLNSSYNAKTFYFCTWRTLCWLCNAFSLENSIRFTLFKEKIIGRRWGPKRGSFPLLGGRWMFGREMGSKRGSLPPKVLNNFLIMRSVSLRY